MEDMRKAATAIILVVMCFGPVWAAPAESPAISATVALDSCLKPGKECTQKEMEWEHAYVSSELQRMEAEMTKLRAQNGGAGAVLREGSPGLALHRRILGFRKMECQLRRMKDSRSKADRRKVLNRPGAGSSSSLFTAPGR